MDAQGAKDFEITGISRSGRVRKKSSKLLDFQSPDDIELKVKKTSNKQNSNSNKSVTVYQAQPDPSYQTISPINTSINENKSEIESGDEIPDSIDDNSHTGVSDSEICTENPDNDEGNVDPTVKQSVYMSEKFNKKKVLKDGKVVYSKAQRKDKGKSRFTAYMLWSRDVRKHMMKKKSDMDFATVSRRLGEMWANVTTNEKFIWKKRAKRLASLGKSDKQKEILKVPTIVHKGSVGRPRKHPLPQNVQKTVQIEHNNKISDNNTSIQQKQSTSSLSVNYKSNTTNSNINKIIRTDPIDIAAHMKLLGDNLIIIGERLKEHEGQITFSGSLSVLLDSLLCSLAPLMCLSAQIPKLEEKMYLLRETMQKTLDNIAYVMPGL